MHVPDAEGDEKCSIEFHAFFNQTTTDQRTKMKESSVIIDIGSSVNIFSSESLVTDIRKSSKVLRLETNVGIAMLRQEKKCGDLDVWFNKASIANVLSFYLVTKERHIIVDTAFDNETCVCRGSNDWMVFEWMSCGLHMCDAVTLTNCSKPTFLDYCFLQIVENTKLMCAAKDVRREEETRFLHGKIGRLGQVKFYNTLDAGLILNYPFMSRDTKRADDIFGKEMEISRGREIRDLQRPMPRCERRDHPASAMKERNIKVRLSSNICHVNGLPFLHTMSENIQFRTVASMPNSIAPILLGHSESAMSVCTKEGFDVEAFEEDKEFEHMQGGMSTGASTLDRHSYVHQVERSIRNVKECIQCTTHGLPFNCLPKSMVVSLTEFAIRNLNRFPGTTGMSNFISPLTIVTGPPRLDYNMLKLSFGDYAEVHEDNGP